MTDRHTAALAALEQSPPTEVAAINLAKRFHESYERLAPKFGYKTRNDTREFDEHSSNGKLMIAVAGEILDTLEQPPPDADALDARRWRHALKYGFPVRNQTPFPGHVWVAFPSAYGETLEAAIDAAMAQESRS